MKDLFTGHGVALARYDEKLQAQILAILRGLENDILEDLRNADPTKLAKPTHRLARLQTMLPQLHDTIDGAYDGVQDRLYDGLMKAAENEHDWLGRVFRQMLGPVADLVDLNTTTVSPGLLRKLVSDTVLDFGGKAGAAPVAKWIDSQRDEVKARLTKELRTGLYRGESIDELARRISGGGKHAGVGNADAAEGIMPISRNWAKATARTSVNQITGDVRREMYRENERVVKGVVQVSTIDDRTTVTCLAYANRRWLYEGADLVPDGHSLPFNNGCPRHVACFPAAVRVHGEGRILAASERSYKGPLVRLRTSSGLELPCTPNHPVLTLSGWQPAEQLTPGSVVFVADDSSSPAPPTSIGGLFRRLALMFARRQAFVVTAPDSFHGDDPDGGEARVVFADDRRPVWAELLATATDAIEAVRQEPFEGLVYNLQTSTGRYSAAGIIVQNCRSLEAPYVKSWQEMGLDEEDVPAEFRRMLDGAPPPVLDGDAILRRLPEKKQIAALGRTRWEAWKGGASLDSFLDEEGGLARLKD